MNDILLKEIETFTEQSIMGIQKRQEVAPKVRWLFSELNSLNKNDFPNEADVRRCFGLSEEILNDLSLLVHGKAIGAVSFSLANSMAHYFSRLADHLLLAGFRDLAIEVYYFIGSLYETASEAVGFNVDGYTKSAIRRPALFWEMRGDQTRLSKPKSNIFAIFPTPHRQHRFVQEPKHPIKKSYEKKHIIETRVVGQLLKESNKLSDMPKLVKKEEYSVEPYFPRTEIKFTSSDLPSHEHNVYLEVPSYSAYSFTVGEKLFYTTEMSFKEPENISKKETIELFKRKVFYQPDILKIQTKPLFFGGELG